MKRLFCILTVGLLLGGMAAFAEIGVLVDFTQLAADTTLSNDKVPSQNGATLIDFSGVAGASFTDEEKAAMKSSLAIANWDILLSSSSRTVQNQALTMTREATMAARAKPLNGVEMAGKKVLGVRIHFPVESYNAWAMIQPPFDIPAYADKTELQGDKLVPVDAAKGKGTKFDNFGVIKNVSVIKSLSVTVYGSNFPNGLGVVIADQDGREQTIFLDYLQFDGWRTLTWNNPNYITEVRNRELRKFPLYPHSTPYVKLIGLVIYRDAAHEGGDFVSYIKDITVVYDKAVMDTERDINDESVWNILQQRNEARRLAELKRLGNLQVLRYLEKQKMASEAVSQ